MMTKLVLLVHFLGLDKTVIIRQLEETPFLIAVIDSFYQETVCLEALYMNISESS